MSEVTHKHLVEAAYRWVLKRASCGVAFKELNTSCAEYPDVIGFGSWAHSVLVECKTSRTDFFADAKKEFRKNPDSGMGTNRYYCCPKGLIKKDELPKGWGLLYVNEKLQARLEYDPLIPHEGEYGTYNERYTFTKNIHAEHRLMYSALRRLHLRGRIDEIYIPLEQVPPRS